MMLNNVYVGKINYDVIKYPTPGTNYSPSVSYPEYSFSDISSAPNPVYDIIRDGFYRLGFDKEHYGLSEWNPLSSIIRQDDVVVIKPNMVNHINYNINGDLDCLITNISLIRVIIDYVLIALKGSGKIIIADSPIQDCDFTTLIKKNGYVELINYYKQHNISIDIYDLREFSDKITTPISVDLGKNSYFNQNECFERKWRVLNYDMSLPRQHHSKEKNEYAIAKKILEADVIINMPKPKTHRFAGVTISMKNMVGINANKSWIPHYSALSKSENGDEYPAKDSFKKIKSRLLDLRGRYYPTINKYHLKYPATAIIKIYDKFLSLLHLCKLSKDTYSGGCWYGNDTIWRTILDLNMIVRYADKNGIICSSTQRKVFNIADMVIAGEGQGPLSPSPVKTGMIVMSEDTVCLDETVSAIMGVDYHYIPTIRNARYSSSMNICSNEDARVVSNIDAINNKTADELLNEGIFHFKMASGWEEYK